MAATETLNGSHSIYQPHCKKTQGNPHKHSQGTKQKAAGTPHPTRDRQPVPSRHLAAAAHHAQSSLAPLKALTCNPLSCTSPRPMGVSSQRAKGLLCSFWVRCWFFSSNVWIYEATCVKGYYISILRKHCRGWWTSSLSVKTGTPASCRQSAGFL